MNLDKRIKKLVERIDAEKVVVALTYDKQSFWRQRGKGRHNYEIRIEWEHGDTYEAGGAVEGLNFAAVFRRVEAEINGILIRRRTAPSSEQSS